MGSESLLVFIVICALPILTKIFTLTDKAAQAAAQAAQAAAMQTQYQVQMASQNTSTLTAEQALQLLEKFGISNIIPGSNMDMQAEVGTSVNLQGNAEQASELLEQLDNYGSNAFNSRASVQYGASTFSPFSPDPNYLADNIKNMNAISQPQHFGFQGKQYSSWYGSQDEKASGNGKVSASMQARPPSTGQRFGPFLGGEPSTPPSQGSRASSRQEGPIARPDLSRRPSQLLTAPESYNPGHEQHHDSSIHDLNGTLASLALDQGQASWKSAERLTPTSP